jgi:hypothetical protein
MVKPTVAAALQRRPITDPGAIIFTKVPPAQHPSRESTDFSWVTVRSEETLLRLLRPAARTQLRWKRSRATIHRWGLGSVFLNVNETGRRLLRILPQP